MNLILYFTGTGNTLYLADLHAKELENTELMRIDRNFSYCEIPGRVERLGIYTPVYRGGLPKMVAECLGTLKFSHSTYIYSALTYGASYFRAAEQLRNILNENGIDVNAEFGYRMPPNNSTHKLMLSSADAVQRISISREKALVDSRIIKGKIPLLLPDDSKENLALADEMYSVFSPHGTDSGFHLEGVCSGCGLCEKVCPAGNIVLTGTGPVWDGKCERCAACINVCPLRIIEYSNTSQGKGRYINPYMSVSDLIV